MVQWLRLRAFTAEGAGSIPGQETKISQAVQHGYNKTNNAEERISDLEDRIMEITQSGQQTESKMKKKMKPI